MQLVTEAQADMKQAYFWGIPGVMCSGTVWLIAGLVALLYTPFNGILTLIFGGILIFPASVLVCKLIGASGKHHKSNPLAPLAIEGTFWMLLSIPIAVAASMYKIELFFPAMMLVIAGRYLTFSTLYGMRIFWLFAVVLIAGSGLLVATQVPVFQGALLGGFIEVVFAALIFFKIRTTK